MGATARGIAVEPVTKPGRRNGKGDDSLQEEHRNPNPSLHMAPIPTVGEGGHTHHGGPALSRIQQVWKKVPHTGSTGRTHSLEGLKS